MNSRFNIASHVQGATLATVDSLKLGHVGKGRTMDLEHIIIIDYQSIALQYYSYVVLLTVPSHCWADDVLESMSSSPDVWMAGYMHVVWTYSYLNLCGGCERCRDF